MAHYLDGYPGSTSFGTNCTLIEQSNSGGVSGSRQEFYYKGDKADVLTAFNYIRSLAAAGTKWQGSYIEREQCRMEFSPGWSTLTVVVDIDADDTHAQYSTDDTPVFMPEFIEDQVPISLHPNYHPIWDNSLWYSIPTAELDEPVQPTLPQKYSDYQYNKTAQVKVYQIAEADQYAFAFAKERPSDFEMKGIRYRWIEAVHPKFPRLEVFSLNTIVVVETRRFKSKSSAMRKVAVPNSMKVPGETFGYPSGTEHWVVKPQDLAFDGERYVVVNRYYYADEWNEEIYNHPAISSMSAS